MSDFRFISATALLSLTLFSAQASALTSSDVALSNLINIHTYTSTPSTKPAASFAQLDKAYKLAGVCFMGFGDCGNLSFGKGDETFALPDCPSIGYPLTSCTPPGYPDKFCPYDASYFASCKENPSKACADTGYINSCPTGEILDPNGLCPYDKSYGNCICNPCTGYDYTYEEATEQGYEVNGDACDSCGSLKYKRKAAECRGYYSCNCGGEIGSPDCWSGSLQLFQKCQECCDHKCTLDACPSGVICTLEECSGKYCAIGCAVGSVSLEDYWCNGALQYWMPPMGVCQGTEN